MIGIGLIGLGHWGPNYLRIFSGLENASVVAGADVDASRFDRVRKSYPQVHLTHRIEDIFSDPRIEAVVIATPTVTHFALVQQALKAGKHVLVEKPLALRTSEAQELTDQAKAAKRILMVGHTFLYNPGIQTMKKILDSGELGNLFYVSMVRANLGPIRNDVNALVDLAPHDISILLYFFDALPSTVNAQGAGFLRKNREDVVFTTLRFPSGVLAQMHVSWLEPVKVRLITIIGDKKMAVFNDVLPMESIKIFDKGVSFENRAYANFAEFHHVIREGQIIIPKLTLTEPLDNQCRAFCTSIETGIPPLSDGAFGVKVVQVLEAASQSLQAQGTAMSPHH